MILKNNCLYFLVYRYDAFKSELGFYQTSDFKNKLYLIRAEELEDYKPLVMHGVLTKFKFALHHYLSLRCSDKDMILEN